MASSIDIDSVFSGANAPFIAELYARYLDNPGSVDASWQAVFGELTETNGVAVEQPSWSKDRTRIIGVPDPEAAKPAKGGAKAGAAAGLSEAEVKAAALDSVRALMIIRAYRARGHLVSNLDPLGLAGTRFPHPELDPAHFGFGEADMDRPIFLANVLGREKATLREIMSILRDTYCGNIGVEYTHISDPARKSWLQERIEGIRNQTDFTENGKKAILERLTAAESFERFLHVKYTGTKRFGLDGGEAAIPALEQIVKRGGQLGVQEIVIGMAHRGRLNVLTNFMGKPFRAVFSEFQGNPANPSDVQGSGDVKYHLGTSTDREFDGKNVHLSLTANPSHLEVVDAVVLGKVRAKQTQLKDTERRKVLGLLIHGDAAFAGQGIVAECFGMSELKGYRTGGTIHLIINNQIGFTTSPAYSRSSPYPSDVAKMVEAPIFHVNGDDPEAVVHVARVATEYRQEFGVDVVIDIFCYRRFGHNEGDEPAYTQPLMYQAIGQHPSVRKLYAQRLVEEKLLTQDEADQVEKDFMAYLEEEFQAGNSYKPNKADWLEGAWSGMETASGDDRRGETSVPLEKLREIGLKLCEMPEGLDVNRKLVRQLEDRKKRLEAGENLDWATGEALAFGTLLTEGYPVRLSGQDSGRGTFSHRHAVVIDQTTEERYVPLANLSENQAQFEVIDSPLAEMSVLGFEYGYTLSEPRALVLWEAQFGDCTNGAQVMLLPHGYEGQGPEHSSARLERYLQQCAEDNMQVVNVTTPANYFHVLRRQLHRKFRKPLVIMTPKSLLRHKLAVSTLADMAEGTTFHRVLYDNEVLCDDKDVKRVVLCSGKVYYDLYEERAKRGIKDVFFLRLEQLYPFPHKALADELKRFPKAEVVWCQEEPENMGSWTFVDRRIEAVLTEIGAKQKRPVYVGRPAAAATATGLLKRHNLEQAKLVDEALSGKI